MLKYLGFFWIFGFLDFWFVFLFFSAQLAPPLGWRRRQFFCLGGVESGREEHFWGTDDEGTLKKRRQKRWWIGIVREIMNIVGSIHNDC